MFASTFLTTGQYFVGLKNKSSKNKSYQDNRIELSTNQTNRILKNQTTIFTETFSSKLKYQIFSLSCICEVYSSFSQVFYF